MPPRSNSKSKQTPTRTVPAPASGRVRPLPKARTGITGLDTITNGGLPLGRPTLVCGGAGCGKTLFGLEFLLHGALDDGEPGVFMAFEETEPELIQNVASLGYDLQDLIDRQLILLDYVHVERSEIEETGDYDLEGLFIRLGTALDSIGAKRLVLDTLEALFGGFTNQAIMRTELRRLFRWLKQRGVTLILTAERGDGTFTRHGLEEYVSDCVILLDNRVVDQVTTRRIRIVKYRGSAHGTNEYPFLIDEHGIAVLPITAMGLAHTASTERISSGVAALDAMLGGRGYYRGSSILVSGTAGTGKSSLAAHFAQAAAQRGERTLYFAFEESPSQIQRNMRSIGIDLEQPERRGLLRFHAVRPNHYGLEMHLVIMLRAIEVFQPQVAIVDPLTNLLNIGSGNEVRATLTRLIDYLKTNRISGLFTSLTSDGAYLEHTDVGISSLVDTWIVLRTLEGRGERNRGLSIIKSRGMAHSNQLREYELTDHGLQLVDVYTGPGGVLTGSARAAQETEAQTLAAREAQELERHQRMLERKREALEAQIEALRAQFEAETEDAARALNVTTQQTQLQAASRTALSQLRWVAPEANQRAGNGQPRAPRTTKAKRR
jgi:circadian clock protein KaiC